MLKIKDETSRWFRNMVKAVRDKLRASSWLIVAGAAVVYLAVTGNPIQDGVLAWKALLLTSAAYLGYWIDRNLFPGARPHALEAKADGDGPGGEAGNGARRADAARLRRAIVVAAVILAAAIGI